MEHLVAEHQAPKAGVTRALAWPSTHWLRDLEGWLLSGLQPWCSDWGVPLAKVACHPAWETPDTPGAGSRNMSGVAAWVALPGTSGAAWIRAASPSPAEQLALTLFGAAPPSAETAEISAVVEPSGSIALDVGEDAWAALQAACTGLMPNAVRSIPGAMQAPDPGDARPWSGAVRALVWLGASEAPAFHLHLSPASAAAVFKSARLTPKCPPHDPQPPPAPSPLRSLAQALSRHPLQVHVRLRDVAVTLGQLQSLRQGDVLLTAHDLSWPLTVWPGRAVDHATAGSGKTPPAASAQPMSAGWLVQHSGSTAVALMPLSDLAAKQTTSNLATYSEITVPSPDPVSQPVAQLINLPAAVDVAVTAPRLAPSLSPLLGVRAQLQVCVGQAVLSVGELTSAKVGHVIRLDRQVDGPVDLLLDGHVVARGQLVAVDDVFGIRLTELPAPLLDAASVER